MASEALLKRIQENKDWLDAHGISQELIDANVQLAQYAIHEEKDVKCALDLSALTKRMIDKVIEVRTEGHTFWELEHLLQVQGQPNKIIDDGYALYRIEAPYRFESFMFYMEKNRKYEKRFYVPRRNTLKIAAEDLQAVDDDKYDEYGLSMPSRVGKSTICIFFLAWVGYKRPWSHSAMGGHAGQLAKRFFLGYKDLVETPEYTFSELFKELHPELPKVVERISSDPAEYTINLGEPDAFATMSCRGIDGTWTGAIDVSNDGYLYVDDLVRDREHSMSPTRLENTYQEMQNKMLDRLNDKSKIILVGTRWNVQDPLGREEKLHEDNERAFFRKIPALDENDKSNFRYEYNGFSSSYYIHKQRDRLDKAEWMAKFQQEPFVREGLLFPTEELRYFNGVLPDGTYKTVAALDPAFGRGDSLSMPICRDFGDKEKYIIDWIHDKRTPGYTVPLIVEKIDEHYITELQIEKNNGGDLMAQNISDELEKRGIHHCKIVRKSAPVGIRKEDKISGHADDVKRYFQFLLPKKWTDVDDSQGFIYRPSEQYRKALDEMAMYSPEGRNPNDDAADSIAQLMMMFDGYSKHRKARIISSPI